MGKPGNEAKEKPLFSFATHRKLFEVAGPLAVRVKRGEC